MPYPVKNPYSYPPFTPNTQVQYQKTNDTSPIMASPYTSNVQMAPLQTAKFTPMNNPSANIIPVSIPTNKITSSLPVTTSTTKQSIPSNPTNKHSFNFQQPIGIVDKYMLLAELGQDHLYPVYLGYSIFDQPEAANLVVLKAIPATDHRGSFENEKNIFQLKYHKHLLRCTEIIKNARFFFGTPSVKKADGAKPNPGAGFYNVLVLNYHINGDFLEFVRKRKLEERVARYYFAQILDAIEHLHLNGYCHRDLKIENILLDQNFDLVLTDFGHSVRYRDQYGERVFIEENSITTPGICPPEFHKGYGYRGVPMDIFALGKLLLIFVTGFNPFKTAKETDQNFSLILKGQWANYWKLTQGWMKKKWLKAETFNKDLKALLEAMLNPDPNKRPSIQQIRESNWFKKTVPATNEEVQLTMIRAKNQA